MDFLLSAGKQNNFLKKAMQIFTIVAFLGTFYAPSLFAQNFDIDSFTYISEDKIPVDFYKTNSNSTDLHIIAMTTDLFYTQFLALEKYEVTDYREIEFTVDEEEQNICFYVDLNEAETGGWICKLNAARGNQIYSQEKTYASYYKILLEAKNELEQFLKNFFEWSKNPSISQNNNNPQKISKPQNDVKNWEENFPEHTHHPNEYAPKIVDTEIISGTWCGEQFIDRIVILRSGRGFVIFKNGANMSIAVDFNDNKVTVTQTGKPNASFFPELPREIALKNAIDSKPIQWKLALVNGELQGTKTTLQEDKNSATGASVMASKVVWVRK